MSGTSALEKMVTSNHVKPSINAKQTEQNNKTTRIKIETFTFTRNIYSKFNVSFGIVIILNGLIMFHNAIPNLGPLHTRAKSRDHEIVRVQKKVFKGHYKPP